MICSSVNLLFLMSAILLVGGLLLLQAGTAAGGQVTLNAPWTVYNFDVDSPPATLSRLPGGAVYVSSPDCS